MHIDVSMSKLTDEELDEKINKLQKIVFSSNYNLSLQARNILPAYLEEQDMRSERQFQEYSNVSGINLTEIINIG